MSVFGPDGTTSLFYFYKPGLGSLQLPVIDASNKTGSMEFACGGNADDFFPVRVSFYSKKSYSEIQVCTRTLAEW